MNFVACKNYRYVLWRQSGSKNTLTGVGLSIGYPKEKDKSSPGLVVVSAAPGGPAYRAGILSGDFIVAIDDKSTESMEIYDAAERLQWVSSMLTLQLMIKSMNFFKGCEIETVFVIV